MRQFNLTFLHNSFRCRNAFSARPLLSILAARDVRSVAPQVYVVWRTTNNYGEVVREDLVMLKMEIDTRIDLEIVNYI